MMIRFPIFLTSIALAATAASAQSNGGVLGKVNGFLQGLNNAAQGNRPGASAGGGMAPLALARQSPEQKVAITQALRTPVQEQIAADRQEAAPLIEEIVTTSACAINDSAWNHLNRYRETPKTYGSSSWDTIFSPVGRTQYHQKDQCLDVIRVTNWAKPARNALSFQVQSVSAQSDEAKRQDFILVRDNAGQWLLREVSGVAS